jgi:hypothetical protein
MGDIEVFMTTEAKNGKEFSFGIGNNGKLYVNGKEVITKQKLTFNWILNYSVALGGLGAFAQGLIAVFNHFDLF